MDTPIELREILASSDFGEFMPEPRSGDAAPGSPIATPAVLSAHSLAFWHDVYWRD